MFRKLVLAVGISLCPLAAPAAADGDQTRGSQVFKQRCAACHSVERGKLGMGPSLAGVVGRPVASTKFPYSAAMKKAGIVWTEANIDSFLKAPAATVKGNRMALAPLTAAKDRADIVAYLKGRK